MYLSGTTSISFDPNQPLETLFADLFSIPLSDRGTPQYLTTATNIQNNFGVYDSSGFGRPVLQSTAASLTQFIFDWGAGNAISNPTVYVELPQMGPVYTYPGLLCVTANDNCRIYTTRKYIISFNDNTGTPRSVLSKSESKYIFPKS